MMHSTRIYALTAALFIAGCTVIPEGPSVRALPGKDKSSEQFRNDDTYCRQLALEQSGGKTPDQNAVDSGVRSAALGTVVGAAAGAVIGGHHGAGVGAGTGLVVGSLAGAGAAERSARTTQQRYDISYAQCMYDMGNRVPVPRGLAIERRQPVYLPPPQVTPASTPATTFTPTSSTDKLFIYPKNSQTEAQIEIDRRNCANWASSQTGYDSVNGSPSNPKHNDFSRAMAACLESNGYVVK